MKKVISLFLSAMLVLTTVTLPVSAESEAWNGVSYDYSWYSSSNNSFTISTPAQFAALAKIVRDEAGSEGISKDDFSGDTITLDADLDFGGNELRPVGWTGAAAKPFKGTFDGNGHIVKNISIKESNSEGRELGLFARVQSGTVKNLGVEDVSLNLTTVTTDVGAIAGMFREAAQIYNCFVRNVTFKGQSATDAHYGALLGYTRKSNLVINNCYSTNINIDSGFEAGNNVVSNLIGYINDVSGMTVSNCYAGVYNENADMKIAGTGVWNASVEASGLYYDAYANETSKEIGTYNENLKAQEMEGYVLQETEDYNFGYPILLWEQERLEQEEAEEDTTVFEVVSKTADSIVLTDIEGALYSVDGENWYENNEFTDLTSGLYKFSMKKSYDSEKIYTLMAVLGERRTDFDVWDGSVDASWYNAEDDVYYIYNAAELAGFGSLSRTAEPENFVGKTIYLMADIDMNNIAFEPIGYGAKFFGGKFVGNGHIVKNLNINQSVSDGEVGFFGRVDGSIEGLGIENVKLSTTGSASHNIGGLVGYLRNGSISDCFVRNADVTSIAGTAVHAGGFVGYTRDANVSNSYITNFTVTDEAVNPENIGNFCGYARGSGFAGSYAGYDNQTSHEKLHGFVKVLSSEPCTFTNTYYDATENLAAAGGTKADTEDIKSLKVMSGIFDLSYDDAYNYGYPVLKWENPQDITYKDIDIKKEGNRAYLIVKGLKNNTDKEISPVLSVVMYDNGYMKSASMDIVTLSEYALHDEAIVELDITKASENSSVSAMIYQGYDMGVPLLRNVVIEN